MEYKRTTTWGEIGNKFFSREKENAMKSIIKRQQVKDKIFIEEMTTIEKNIIDEKTGIQNFIKESIKIKGKISSLEAENEFYNRIKKRNIEKENRLRILEENIHENNCTFKPLILEMKSKRVGKYKEYLRKFCVSNSNFFFDIVVCFNFYFFLFIFISLMFSIYRCLTMTHPPFIWPLLPSFSSSLLPSSLSLPFSPLPFSFLLFPSLPLILILIILGTDEEDESDAEEEEEKNPVKSFLNRMENDFDRRKKDKPERFISRDDMLDKIEFLNSHEAFK